MRKWNSPNLSKTKVFQCLGHSNWTICSPLSPICSVNFPTFSLLYWEANSYYPRERKAENEKREITRNGWDPRVWVPGAFKLDHLQPLKPILFRNFSNFCTFILEGQFLLPQVEEGRKWEKGNHHKWMRPKSLSAWGIQTGPFAAH